MINFSKIKFIILVGHVTTFSFTKLWGNILGHCSIHQLAISCDGIEG